MSILEKLTHLEREAETFGFKWENANQIMDQIKSECLEIEEHLNHQANEAHETLQEEIGDLLHAVFSLCVFCQFDVTETLAKSADKFERRLNAVKSIAHEKGIASLNGFAFDELMTFWDQAKKRVK